MYVRVIFDQSIDGTRNHLSLSLKSSLYILHKSRDIRQTFRSAYLTQTQNISQEKLYLFGGRKTFSTLLLIFFKLSDTCCINSMFYNNITER